MSARSVAPARVTSGLPHGVALLLDPARGTVRFLHIVDPAAHTAAPRPLAVCR